MKPIKIYVGKNLYDGIMEQITRSIIKQPIPSCDFYDPKPSVIDVNELDLAKILDC
jgi:hypothetical protein